MSKEFVCETPICDNSTWANLSNSDNSGEAHKKKLPASNTINQTGVIEKEKPILTATKRGRGEFLNNNGKKIGSEESSDQDQMHIWTERERRKKMRNMFANLHSLLPQLPPKADKSTIVDEAVKYIKTLQHTLNKLQQQKVEFLQGKNALTNTSSYKPSQIAPQRPAATDTREAFLADQGSFNSPNLAITTSSKPTSYNNIPPSTLSMYPRVFFQTWTSSNVVLNICGDEAQISICSRKKPGFFATICYLLEKYNIEVLSAHVSSYSYHSVYMIQAHANGAFDECVETFPVEEIFRQAAGEIMCWVSS